MGVADLVSLADPATYTAGVPHEEFARRRREAPTAWVEEVPLWRHGAGGGRAVRGSGYWAITRHSTVVAVSRRPDVFSSALRGAFLADPVTAEDLERTRQLLINMDAPEHTRTRHAVSQAFTPRLVERLTASIHAHADALVHRARERRQFDVVADLAADFPVLVMADLLGMPRDDRRLMIEWSNALVGFDDPQLSAGNVAAYKRTFAEAFAYATRLAEQRRRRPADDLVTALVAQASQGDALSDEEICQLWLLLVVGGNESTRHLLSGAIHALIETPEECRRLAASPAVPPSAVEELLRWVSPVMQFRRTVTRDVEVDGQAMRAGDKVVLYYVSANRDESVFTSPDRLDLLRAPNPHLAFGIGPHFCLGARLARVEAAALLTALKPHLTQLELTAAPARLASNFMNGIKSMPAQFRA